MGKAPRHRRHATTAATSVSTDSATTRAAQSILDSTKAHTLVADTTLELIAELKTLKQKLEEKSRDNERLSKKCAEAKNELRNLNSRYCLVIHRHTLMAKELQTCKIAEAKRIQSLPTMVTTATETDGKNISSLPPPFLPANSARSLLKPAPARKHPRRTKRKPQFFGFSNH